MSTSEARATREAYHWCRELAASHYENFPVASWLLPARLRDPVAAIYAFARCADDIADEGSDSIEQRLDALKKMEMALHAMETGTLPAPPLYRALADTIHRHGLSPALFHDLLSAFRQDVEKTRYKDFGELMNYCRRSANPVGRLLLTLNNSADAGNLAMSDAVCSALQLINFLQDIDQDYSENGRIYLPLDDMQRFGVSEQDIHERRNSEQLNSLIRFQVRRAAQLLRSGSPLGARLGGRFGLEIRAIILGGSRVLEKLYRQPDIFARPRLDLNDRLKIIFLAFSKGFARPRIPA